MSGLVSASFGRVAHFFCGGRPGGSEGGGRVRIKRLLVVSANPRSGLFSRSKKKISSSAFYFPAYSNPIGHVRDIEKTTAKK